MSYIDFLKKLFPDSHNVDGEVYSVLLGAIGSALDKYDPVQMNLKSEFSVTTAIATALDKHGQDWGDQRRNNESDTSFRQRILSMLPLYVNGPSIPGIEAVVASFTGYSPTIFEYGPGSFVMGESAIGDFGFCSTGDAFTFEIHIQNPNNVSYNHLDLENAVRKAKLARSTAIIFHNGADTSTAAEQSTATITIT